MVSKTLNRVLNSSDGLENATNTNNGDVLGEGTTF